ncbi:Ammonium transporter [Ectocarpus siliculosus]|uniref:Ammonium transporter n=1 Tax=Ectocarpus siliculosus TaxID=2880 RepID=D7FL37_ECTSI|nr:Ammonium transporter [Ectocarpus siliculosus]|eukprot:CBJ29574.1 Ammonium transporter [Ectocarpus siliculosus]
MDPDTVEAMSDLAKSIDFTWMFVCLVLVVLMQAGFAAYEVGSIRSTSASSILKKNIGDATLSLIAWVLVGYALSDGKDQLRIVGGSYFGLVQGEPFEATDDRDVGTALLECLFRWSFAATCTTIVSGAVADRIYVKAYFVYAFLTSAVFYPLLAHAVWADEGWASPFLTSEGESAALLNCGFVDFAGSGVVHMLGGGIGLVLSIMVENRSDRFIDADPELVEKNTSATLDRRLFKVSHNLLPRDRYGFNCGSTLQISSEETRNAAGRAALNTTIGAAVGCVSSMGFEIMYHWWSPKYRRGEFINDPLDYLPQTKNECSLKGKVNQLSSPAGAGPRRRKTTGATDYVVDPEDEHNHGTFRWRLSTHKSIHGAACNGVIVGLVGVTAGCATMLPWHAIWVSIVSALLYHVSYRGIICCKIDDAINAAAVHLVGRFALHIIVL